MGCGASKQSSIVQTTVPMSDENVIRNEQKVNDHVFHSEKEILPGIKGRETVTAVAFEIPLEGLALGSSNTLKSASVGSKNSLPKLDHNDMHSKLAKSEEIWKELEGKKSKRRKGDKPVLSSCIKDDPAELQKKLIEKEAQAALNRQKEKEKLAAKIAAQEQRARLVLERKKQMANSSDDEKLSCGGELESSQDMSERSSSCQQDSVTNSSRVGSGKSSDTDTTDVDDRDQSVDSYQSSPESIKKIPIKKSTQIENRQRVRI